MSNKKGKIFIVSAPSGTGKSTLIEGLLKELPELKKPVSYTTREPRNGEVHGVDYNFISLKEFEKMKENNIFIEWAKVHDNFYASSLKAINDGVKQGYFLVKDLDTQGALNLKKELKDLAVLIFISPPDMDELERRLRSRRTDTEEIIQLRLQNALKEMSLAVKYDYRVVNENIDETIRELKAIVTGQMKG